MPSAGFHYPYYGGGGAVEIEGNFGGVATAERPIPFTVNLHGVEYPIDLVTPRGEQLYRRQSLDRQRQGVVQSSQPDDTQFNNDGAWWRYVYSWHLGTGQGVQDFGEEYNPNRFADSRGVDPWDDFGIQLLPDVEILDSLSGSNCKLVATGSFVYMCDGATVRRTADLITWVDLTGTSGTVRDMCTDGSTVYVATTAHIYTFDDGGGTAAVTKTANTDDYLSVAFVGNRLLASAGNILYEIGSGGGAARTAFETHYQNAFRWTAIFSIGSRIYIGGYAGNRTEIYTATVDSSGNLVRSAEAAPFPSGELLNFAISYGGQVVLCTSLGIRLAALAGDGSLSYGALIDAPGNVRCATAEGRFVWFGWSEMFADGCGVGRLALDTAVRPLQPAYATDVFTTDASTTVVSVCRFNNRTVFAVASTNMYATDTGTYVDEGWVESGQVFLGTIEPKALTSIAVRCDELATSEGVSVGVTDEQGYDFGTYATVGPDSFGLDASLVQSTDAETQVVWAKVRLTLSGPGTSTPIVRSWRLRAFPVTPMVEEWIVPLIIHRHVVVNDADGQLRSLDQLEQVERLITACRNNSIVPYREGIRTYRVRIDKYEWDPTEWDDTSDFFDGRMVVRLLSA